MTRLRATSWLLPDTTLHRLNGNFVVDISEAKVWLTTNAPWLTPDEADAFADSIKEAAAFARGFRETDDDDDDE